MRFPFPEIVKKLFDAGRLGAKVGKGIYSDGTIDDEFRNIVASIGGKDHSFSLDRCILRAANEAVYCRPGEAWRLLTRSTGPSS